MARETATIDTVLEGLMHNTRELDEFAARAWSHRQDVMRIGKFLPKRSARRYLKESDKRLDAEMKDKVVIPEFSAEELARMDDEPELRDALLAVAGKTGAEVDTAFPSAKEDYSESTEEVRLYLAQCWLHTVLACHARHKEDTQESALCLRDDLLPEESKEEVERNGGSHLGYVMRDLTTAGILYEEQQNACYAEFTKNIKAYLEAHPKGLVLGRYDNIRLFKDGGRFIARQA